MFKRQPAQSSFREAILRHFGVEAVEEVNAQAERMGIEYALSSIERGQNALNKISARNDVSGKRVLDVGCAYGGFVIAASRAGASVAIGIDINPQFVDFAALHLREQSCPGRVFQADILDHSLIEELGQFDLIFCNDVIEHVTDPDKCAKHLSALLAPRGTLFLEIPNPTCVDFMKRDGHYAILGLSLLPRSQAEELWQTRYPPGFVYGVEFFASLPYYIHLFGKCGVSCSLLDDLDQESCDRIMAELASKFATLQDCLEHPEEILLRRSDLLELIKSRVYEEFSRFDRLRATYDMSNYPQEKLILASQAYFDYYLGFWTLCGYKC